MDNSKAIEDNPPSQGILATSEASLPTPENSNTHQVGQRQSWSSRSLSGTERDGGNSSPRAKDIIKIPDSQSGHQAEDNRLSKVVSELNGNTLRMSTPKMLASSPVCLLAEPGCFSCPAPAAAEKQRRSL
ncbi:hypothetical protein A6R68_23977, partial [Neotoma lepida]